MLIDHLPLQVLAGEKLIVTAGAVDSHVHYICPQLWTEVSQLLFWLRVSNLELSCFCVVRLLLLGSQLSLEEVRVPQRDRTLRLARLVELTFRTW